MAVGIQTLAFPYTAASAVQEGMAVGLATGADRSVHAPSQLALHRPIGIALATAASAGDPIAVQTYGPAKAWAATSISGGMPVAVASINGALGPFIASPATAANGNRFPIGIAEHAASAGDRFTVFISPITSL